MRKSISEKDIGILWFEHFIEFKGQPFDFSKSSKFQLRDRSHTSPSDLENNSESLQSNILPFRQALVPGSLNIK